MNAWLAALILGVVEGLTEFLPVSSTGHLLLAEQWLGIRESDAYLVIIQVGAALAVLLAFQGRLAQLWRERAQASSRDYLFKLVAAFAVTSVGGLALKVLHFALPDTATPIGAALLAGGVLFLVVEWLIRGKPASESVTWAMAIAIGAGQILAAVFPGTSRSGVTILIALLMGLDRSMSVEFTFLLGVPTLFAAGGVELLSALRHPGPVPTHWAAMWVCFVVSAVTAFASVRWLLRYVRSHTFVAFGWYRIAVGALVLLPLLFRA